MRSKPSMMRAQLGTVVTTVLTTLFVIVSLIFATYMNESQTFEYICPARPSKPCPEQGCPTSEENTPATATSTRVKTLPTSTSIPDTRFVINFGDSYSRTGFNWTLTGRGSKANPSAENPIGTPEWPGDTSTGGINWLGYMASHFNKTTTLVWNYASSGAVVDRTVVPPRRPIFIDFAEQVRQFKASIGQRPDYAPWTPDNAVAGIWLGLNDFGESFRWDNLSTITSLLSERLIGQSQVLYDIGLRNFLFIEIPALDLLPMYEKWRLDPSDKRPEIARYYSNSFNTHLQRRVDKFRAANPDARATLIQASDIYWDAYRNPQALHAINNTCIDHEKGEKCLWYDGFHPATRIHKMVAARCAEAAWG
ncbi:hypothetical protein B0T10DRAFT_606838 [Thelonectria olida]|uniref:Acetylesterase n=1 Tax=Thelonectria olida TaxID=1576542 RepID=A0A9P9AL96_9HYPO|nr:hypothetical protein B0T10DRAFT_606838 [Thelonectria olida]